MHLDEFLFGAFVYLAAAVLAAPLAVRLGLGTVLGYLLAGMAIGPWVLGLVGRSEGEDVLHFAEFGVVMMLFLIGLELRPHRLWSLRRPILGIGGLQVALTAVALTAGCLALGLDWRSSLAIGLALALSSTAIVLQNINERGLMRTPAGQSVFSVLLFQDIAVIPILAFLPLLAINVSYGADTVPGPDAAQAVQTVAPWLQVAMVVGIVVGIIAAGKFLMNPLFRQIARARSREVFVAASLLIVIGTSLLMEVVGVSPALGAFLAGVVLAENEYRHELEIDLEPFKGLLLAVFFISVGAGIDLKLIAANPLTVLGLVVALIAIKLAVLLGLAWFFNMPKHEGFLFALALAQGGEFAFVLLSYTNELRILPTDQTNIVLAVVAVSMAAAPLLLIVNEHLIQPRLAKPASKPEHDVIDDQESQVIMAGYGRFGMTIGRLLQACGHRPVVLDDDPTQIELLRKFGHKVFYGDAARRELLEAAGARQAKILIIAVSGRDLILQIAETAKEHFPQLQIFARAQDRQHAYELHNAGIKQVYREMFFTSVEVAKDSLIALGHTPRRANWLANKFKDHDVAQVLEHAVYHQDEEYLISSARQAQAEMEKVFQADVDEGEETAA